MMMGSRRPLTGLFSWGGFLFFSLSQLSPSSAWLAYMHIHIIHYYTMYIKSQTACNGKPRLKKMNHTRTDVLQEISDELVRWLLWFWNSGRRSSSSLSTSIGKRTKKLKRKKQLSVFPWALHFERHNMLKLRLRRLVLRRSKYLALEQFGSSNMVSSLRPSSWVPSLHAWSKT